MTILSFVALYLMHKHDIKLACKNFTIYLINIFSHLFTTVLIEIGDLNCNYKFEYSLKLLKRIENIIYKITILAM